MPNRFVCSALVKRDERLSTKEKTAEATEAAEEGTVDGAATTVTAPAIVVLGAELDTADTIDALNVASEVMVEEVCAFCADVAEEVGPAETQTTKLELTRVCEAMYTFVRVFGNVFANKATTFACSVFVSGVERVRVYEYTLGVVMTGEDTETLEDTCALAAAAERAVFRLVSDERVLLAVANCDDVVVDDGWAEKVNTKLVPATV